MEGVRESDADRREHLTSKAHPAPSGPIRPTDSGPGAASRLFGEMSGRGGVQARASAVLALQRGAGNHAVQGAIRSMRGAGQVMRDPPADAPAKTGGASGPSLPPGRSFQWQRRGMAYWLLISKQWLLDHKVSPDALEIADATLFNEILAGIGEVAPWADIALLQKNIQAFMPMKLTPKLSEQQATIIVPLAELPAQFIGNPPGEEVVVQFRKGEAVLWVDAGLIRKHAKDPAAKEIVDANLSARL